MVCVDKSEPGGPPWRMPADERFTNPVGVIQGGFLAACCDSAMGAATVTWAKGEKVFSANAEMKISFLAPVRPGGTLTCASRVVSGRQPGGVRRGRRDRRRGPAGGQGQLDLSPHSPRLNRRHSPQLNRRRRGGRRGDSLPPLAVAGEDGRSAGEDRARTR